MALSDRSTQLANIAGAMPVANQEVANSMNASNSMAFKNQLASVPASVGAAPGLAQKAGAQMAQATGQVQVEAAKQTSKDAVQAGQGALQLKATEGEAQLQEKRLTLSKKQRDIQESLHQLGSEKEQELFTANLTFKKDELGRTWWNERQLIDWKVASAEKQEDFYELEQQVSNAAAKKTQTLKAAHAKILQALQQSYQKTQTGLDNAQTKRLLLAKKAVEDKLRRDAQAKANRGMIITGITTVIGAVYAGPAGATAGAAAGGAINEAI